MSNVYGIDSHGNTIIVGELDSSLVMTEDKPAGSAVRRTKTKEQFVGESFEDKKARLTGKKKKKKDVKEDGKPGDPNPKGDEDAITDPDNETPVGIGNTAKDKKKKTTASECGGSKKKR